MNNRRINPEALDHVIEYKGYAIALSLTPAGSLYANITDPDGKAVRFLPRTHATIQAAISVAKMAIDSYLNTGLDG